MHDRAHFYKYTSAETAKIIVCNRTLRWSSPILFNDPFDITQQLRLQFDTDSLKKAVTDRFAALIETGAPEDTKNPAIKALLMLVGSARSGVRLEMAEELRRDGSEPPTAGQSSSFEALGEMWSKIVPTFRVLCLSEQYDTTSMWLHYCDSYRGVVLRFSAIDELDSPFLVARPVQYQDEAPKIASVEEWAKCITGESEHEHTVLFEEYLFVKTSDWTYEREWRIFDMARPGETDHYADYPFHPKELTGIYFGPICREQDREAIRAALTGDLEHVTCWQATNDGAGAKFSFAPL